jgi:nucleoside-diphosphate-sugar epimerase
VNVVEVVRLAAVRRLIHASTQAVYLGEDPRELLYEIPPRQPRARLQRFELACEHVLTTYAAKHKFELVLLRFAESSFQSVAGGPGVAVKKRYGLRWQPKS